MTTRAGRRGAGFSLIEVSIAMGMLAVVSVGTVGLLTGMIRANRDARMRTEAATLARQTIDEMITSTDVTKTPEMFYEGLVGAEYCAAGGYGAGYTCTPAATLHGGLTRTVVVGPMGNNGVLPVSVDLAWQRQHGTNHLRFNFTLMEPN